MKAKYSLPFKPDPVIRRCTAPSHRKDPDSMDGHCIDFSMPQHTPVLAARGGVVIHRESRWNAGFGDRKKLGTGNGVVLRHKDGEETVYWHAAWRSVKVRLGQHVRRGQILFLSGRTGYTTYPHLHFGVYASTGKSRVPEFIGTLPPKVPYQRYEKQSKQKRSHS
jgi:murein DD-endopeptidase MepM/ murein hydrolase activator NlpD